MSFNLSALGFIAPREESLAFRIRNHELSELVVHRGHSKALPRVDSEKVNFSLRGDLGRHHVLWNTCMSKGISVLSSPAGRLPVWKFSPALSLPDFGWKHRNCRWQEAD
jgi:hypothetical protein